MGREENSGEFRRLDILGASCGKKEGSRAVRKVGSELVSDNDAPERWEQDGLLADVKKGWRHCALSPCTASSAHPGGSVESRRGAQYHGGRQRPRP